MVTTNYHQMKKIIFLFLIASAGFLISCGETGETQVPEPASVAAEAPSDASAGIEGREWVAIQVDTLLYPGPGGTDERNIHFKLDTGRVTGFAGCNTMFGSYTLTGDSLSFGGVASTKMFCEQTQHLEDAFLRALNAVQTYEVNGNELLLKSNNNTIATLRSN